MKPLDGDLLTRIYVKQRDDDPPPADAFAYVLAGNGLFQYRREPFFESAVPARKPPAELATQKQFLRWHCPPLAQEQIEQAVGFFDWASQERGAESVLLIGWREASDAVELICPEQTATSYRNVRGVVYPETVRYELPLPEADRFLVGSIHSHCEYPAYASALDQDDEALFNGLHGVVGRLQDEPPQWHFEGSVDGVRFDMHQHLVFADYRRRRDDYPAAWRERHRVEYTGYLGEPQPEPPRRSNYYDYGDSQYGGYDYGNGWRKSTPRTGWGGAPAPSPDDDRRSSPPDPPGDEPPDLNV